VSWRIGVRHRTGFRYAGTAHASYNEARLSPLDTGTQLTLDHRVEVLPAARLHRYRDYWSTIVHAFDLHRPHTELTVTGVSTVETSGRVAFGEPVGWSDLSGDRVTDRLCEYLAPTPTVPLDEPIMDLAAELRAGRQPREAAGATSAWLRDNLQYEKGTTTVSTTASEVLAERRGVCQDFVHLSLGLLRAAGIPARYASGYLYPLEDGEIGATVVGESHAWFEVWLGSWQAFDPTNGTDVAERHVLVARGRDYDDVPPLKGVYHGAPGQALGVDVELTRIA
jgi:transglutaminase-like putative cysteine protease